LEFLPSVFYIGHQKTSGKAFGQEFSCPARTLFCFSLGFGTACGRKRREKRAKVHEADQEEKGTGNFSVGQAVGVFYYLLSKFRVPTEGQMQNKATKA